MNGLNTTTTSRAAGAAIGSLLEMPARLAAALLSGPLAQRAGGCEIPPPCWEPQPAGTCSLTLCPGGKGVIRVRVLNCGWRPQVVEITAAGHVAGWLSFHPTTLAIGPQETATFGVLVAVPATAPAGAGMSGPLLIRGCMDHFARVDIRVADCATATSCEIDVRDCADNIHHWYDHFYCPRPCRNAQVIGRQKDG